MTDCKVQEQNEQLAGLVGVTLSNVRRVKCIPPYWGSSSDGLVMESDGRHWILTHDQSCCESVQIEDVCGDLSDLIGSPLLQAELTTSESNEEVEGTNYTSMTWAFYKLATLKGYVTVRWCGRSNGCYSEIANRFEEYESQAAMLERFTLMETV